jgi:MFS family permease
MLSANAKLLAFGLVQSSIASGIIYGWPGLNLILKADGMYQPLCDKEEPEEAPNATTDANGGCPAQTQALADLFNVVQASLTGAMVFNGTIIDRWGPRLASSIGSTLVALGAILFAVLPLPQPGDAVDMAYVCLIIMAVGGSAIHLSWFHLANLFPEKRQTTSSVIIAGFVGSGAVFPLWQLLDDASDSFGRREIFMAHGVLVACTVPLAVRLWPDKPFNLGDTVVYTGWTLAWEVVPAAPAATLATAPALMKEDKDHAGQEQQPPKLVAETSASQSKPLVKESDMELCDQLKQPSFYLMLLFFCTHFFRYPLRAVRHISNQNTRGTHFEPKCTGNACRIPDLPRHWPGQVCLATGNPLGAV